VTCLLSTREERAKSTATKTIQPKTAVFQWAALHRPARALRLRMVAAPFGLGPPGLPGQRLMLMTLWVGVLVGIGADPGIGKGSSLGSGEG
jgi:hypothetical protein